jgi:hypothetical protein
MPKINLNARVKQAQADPFEVEWGEHTYKVVSPPWTNLFMGGFSMENPAAATEQEHDDFFTIFFGPDAYEQMLRDNLDEVAKRELFFDAMVWASERMPEHLLPKLEERAKQAQEARANGTDKAKPSPSHSKTARKTSAPSKRTSSATTD